MSQPTSEEVARAAKVAFENSQLLGATDRVNALHSIREELEARKSQIFEANQEDLRVSFACGSVVLLLFLKYVPGSAS